MESEALLLRSIDFGESDRIVHLLTPEHGRVTAMAKGARRSVRRFPGTLDLFNHLRVELKPRRRAGMPLLERAVLLGPFLPLRADPVRYGLACYLVELLGRLAPEGGAAVELRAIFDFGLAVLKTLETSLPDARLRVLLELRALDALGLRPELRRCVRCGSEPSAARVGFHIGDGGVVCERCAAPHEVLMRVHAGTLRALEQGLRFPLSDLRRIALSPSGLAEALQLLVRFQRFHVGVELRSAPFLEEVLASARSTAGDGTRAATVR